jgi:hypothetical protein
MATGGPISSARGFAYVHRHEYIHVLIRIRRVHAPGCSQDQEIRHLSQKCSALLLGRYPEFGYLTIHEILLGSWRIWPLIMDYPIPL